jgi:CPA2 family monovalent cation:H+ antiporter-2
MAMSSTAIVLQTLKEKNLTQTAAGQSSFSVLIFQDIAVIPILALLPLLATAGAEHADDGHGGSAMLELLPQWLQPFIVVAAIGVVFLAGRFIVVPFMRLMAKTRLREMFTAASLLLVIAVAYLMKVVDLSPALGTFLAGVVLANSEYKHELESDLEPFKGLLLGLFFIGVGASLNFALVLQEPIFIFGLVLGLMLLKGIVLFIAGKVVKLGQDQNILFTFLLSQVGEFAFVLLTFSNQLAIIDPYWLDMLMAAVALSMTITPVLLLLNEKFISPYYGTRQQVEEKAADAIDENNKAIIAGFGHFGSTVGRFLRANGVESTILDNDSSRVDMLRKMGFKVYYGDASRLQLLESAGIGEARLLITAIDSPEVNQELIEQVQKHYPQVQIMARARNRMDAYELMEMGVQKIYRESLHTSVQLAIDALTSMGMRKYTASRKGLEFIKHDEAALQKLVQYRHDQKQYVMNVRAQIELQERLLAEEQTTGQEVDVAWDSELLRKAVNGDGQQTET